MRIKVVIVASALALAAGTPVHAQQAAQQSREHEVKEGDTLWDLAQFYYDNPWLWQRIFEANTDVVQDPHWIYPAERLVIPGLMEDFPPEPEPTGTVTRPARTRFYTAPVVSAEREEQPTILAEEDVVRPSVRPGEYYAAPWLSSMAAMRVVGRLAKVNQTADMSFRMTEMAYPYDDLYLSYNVRGQAAVGDRLLLVGLGRRMGDWGRIVEPLAFVEVRALESEVMVVRIQQQFGQVETGALAIPLEPFPEPAMPRPEPVADGAEGEIIAFALEQPLYGMEDMAFIDLGTADGLKVGDELDVIQPEREGNRRVAQRLPSQVVAELRVVRVEEHTATARVFHVLVPQLEPGMPVRVVREMP